MTSDNIVKITPLAKDEHVLYGIQFNGNNVAEMLKFVKDLGFSDVSVDGISQSVQGLHMRLEFWHHSVFIATNVQQGNWLVGGYTYIEGVYADSIFKTRLWKVEPYESHCVAS